MKKCRVANVVVVLFGLVILQACDWSSGAVFGRNPEEVLDPLVVYFGEGTCYGSKRVIRESLRVLRPDCELPVPPVSILAEDKGVLRLWFEKRADHEIPSVTFLTFAPESYGNDNKIAFGCVAGSESVDGHQREVICTPQTASPVSPVDLRSTQREFIFSVIGLQAKCGSTVNFSTSWDRDIPCDSSSELKFGTSIVPSLWVDLGH
ncbi:MAG TPA: hypothetical protein VJB59_07475 [Bdellovibrionota bacterium]|nr:hypothetical protein [Bdellovibrionota bacterium]